MLAETLRKILVERDISVTALAKMSSVSRSNLHQWLQGANPNISQLVQVAKALNVTVDFLLTGISEPEPDLNKLFSSAQIFSGHFEITVKKLDIKKSK